MPKGKSFALVVLASSVIALMPFGPPAAHQSGPAGRPADALAILVAGAGLLCLGGVLRRAA